MKYCAKCDTHKPLDDFYVRRNSKDGRQTWCKLCHNTRRAENAAKNPERQREYGRQRYLATKKRRIELGRAAHLRRKFGISVEDYNALLAAQEGSCAICKRPPSDQHLAVDHCHTTGEIRGLLCGRCNRLVGQADDNPNILERAAAYLNRDALDTPGAVIRVWRIGGAS